LTKQIKTYALLRGQKPGAEPREIIEKSDELRKDVTQLLRLQEALQSDPNLILGMLGIDSSYGIFFCVVSENFIGTGTEENQEVPIIERQHLIVKINEYKSLRKVVQWLMARDFLPIEGVHLKLMRRLSILANGVLSGP
jgi:hypothetical protein